MTISFLLALAGQSKCTTGIERGK